VITLREKYVVRCGKPYVLGVLIDYAPQTIAIAQQNFVEFFCIQTYDGTWQSKI
jgi:hypothetical protein